MLKTKELIAKRSCTHGFREFTSDFVRVQQQRLVNIIESTSFETKI